MRWKHGVIAVGASLGVAASAGAGLMGQTVDLNFLSDDNPFNGGYEVLFSDVLVTNDVEWSNHNDVYNYDDPDNPVYAGWSELSVDIGDTWIDLTFRGQFLHDPDATWGVFYLLPNEGFNGFELLSQFGDLGIAGASASLFGDLPSNHVAAWDLWAESNPAFNDWVDSTYASTLDQSRLGLADPSMLAWNLQGICWEYTPDGSIVSSGIRINLDFVPAPSALAVVLIAGMGASRRRR
ncbi:MAG: hypothetical protein MK101_00300 [Phycisphaerales bacterium]|nr:hypothetical protein [Phycisphaerales bacterium]